MFERPLVFHCVPHFRDFHGCPKILHTIKKTGVRVRVLSPQASFISWKVSVAVSSVSKENFMFALSSITTNCHNDLRGTKPYTRLRFKKREVTDLVQGTRWMSQLTGTG
jgi:hypothetical protein